MGINESRDQFLALLQRYDLKDRFFLELIGWDGSPMVLSDIRRKKMKTLPYKLVFSMIGTLPVDDWSPIFTRYVAENNGPEISDLIGIFKMLDPDYKQKAALVVCASYGIRVKDLFEWIQQADKLEIAN